MYLCYFNLFVLSFVLVSCYCSSKCFFSFILAFACSESVEVTLRQVVLCAFGLQWIHHSDVIYVILVSLLLTLGLFRILLWLWEINENKWYLVRIISQFCVWYIAMLITVTFLVQVEWSTIKSHQLLSRLLSFLNQCDLARINEIRHICCYDNKGLVRFSEN